MHTEKQRNIIRDYLLPIYQELEGRSILDIQSGTGHTVLILRPEPEDYTGLETSPELLKEAARELPPYVFLNIPYPSVITDRIKYDLVTEMDMSRGEGKFHDGCATYTKLNLNANGSVVMGIVSKFRSKDKNDTECSSARRFKRICEWGQFEGKVYGIDVWDRLPLSLDKLIGRIFPNLAKYLLFIGHHKCKE